MIFRQLEVPANEDVVATNQGEKVREFVRKTTEGEKDSPLSQRPGWEKEGAPLQPNLLEVKVCFKSIAYLPCRY
jgi:hypothetical protein